MRSSTSPPNLTWIVVSLSADEFLRTNIIGTQVLLDAARAKGVRRFVQISTDEVMGSLPGGRFRVLYRGFAA
jgi:dTDP-D-glucose 4,6-dehydratase